MKKIIYLTLLLLSVFTSPLLSQTWVSFDNTYSIEQPPLIEVLSSDAMQYKFRITIYGYNKDIVFENNTPYSKISIADWRNLNNVGEPALPTLTQFIGLPANHECSISISDTEWISLPTEKIYPSQEAREESDTTAIEFAINDSIYNSLNYTTNLYNIGEKACIGGMYGVPLFVTPFKYYPSTNVLEIMKSFTVTVDFSQSPVFDGTLSIKNKNLLKGIVANYNIELLNTYNIAFADSLNTNNYDYLIITADKYKETDVLKEFCAWKKIKGHNCKVVSCSEIGGNKSKLIKACIKDWYDKGVEYVLFVGNHEDIPCKMWHYQKGTRPNKHSDYWYVCLDSDYFADLAIGRFCANDTIELSNMVSKTINYENLTPEDTWVTKNLLVSHKENAPGKYQGCSEEIRTVQYNDMPCFTTAYGAPDSLDGDNATNDMVVSYINEGFGVVNYRGHGKIESWEKGWCNDSNPFDITYVKKFKNTKTPIVLSISCNTGDIPDLKYRNCLLHDFVKDKYGAVAFLGSTRPIITSAAHTLNRYLYIMLYENNIYKFGYLNNCAQIANIINYVNEEDSITNAAISNAIPYICGGDPSLEIWTDTISKFSDVDISYENDAININTRATEGYTVTLFSQTDSSYFRKIVVDGSSAIIENLPSSFVLSLNKHNYMPLVYNISNGDIYIQNENYALVRSITGNNIYIGSDVANSRPVGNVTVKSGAELNINAKGKTIIKNGFIIEKGARVFIK